MKRLRTVFPTHIKICLLRCDTFRHVEDIANQGEASGARWVWQTRVSFPVDMFSQVNQSDNSGDRHQNIEGPQRRHCCERTRECSLLSCLSFIFRHDRYLAHRICEAAVLRDMILMMLPTHPIAKTVLCRGKILTSNLVRSLASVFSGNVLGVMMSAVMDLLTPHGNS